MRRNCLAAEAEAACESESIASYPCSRRVYKVGTYVTEQGKRTITLCEIPNALYKIHKFVEFDQLTPRMKEFRK